jgi:hypothetical protein
MSISKAQAEALAEGFLDDLGTSKEGLRPKETFTEIILLAAEFIENAQRNLNKSNSIASGALSESLVAADPTLTNGTFSIDVFMNFYGLFVNKGVKGTRSGNGLYQFKYENPSRKHVAAIQEWIKRASISVRSVKEYKGYGRNEKKNKRIAEFDAAYAIAKSIKLKGLKPTGFLDKAEEQLKKNVSGRLGAALKIDILNSLT